MVDIVLDTCTLVHANNSTSKYQVDSIELINRLLANTTNLVVDDGFHLDETANRSYIGLEYLTHLTPGMLGHSLLQHLAQNGRFVFVSSKVPTARRKYIEQIITNKKDRMFLRITLNSAERVLVSHDYSDYQVKKRHKIKKDLQITILNAGDIYPQLTP